MDMWLGRLEDKTMLDIQVTMKEANLNLNISVGFSGTLEADDFNKAVDGLSKLETIRGQFMWANGFGPEHTRTKLDRDLGSDSWLRWWPQVKPSLNQRTTSDHTTLILDLVVFESGKNEAF